MPVASLEYEVLKAVVLGSDAAMAGLGLVNLPVLAPLGRARGGPAAAAGSHGPDRRKRLSPGEREGL